MDCSQPNWDAIRQSIIAHLWQYDPVYYFIIGEQKDNRQRNDEFAAKDGWTKAMLLDQLDTTIAKAIRTIQNAPSNSFVKIRQVQGFEFSGLGVVLHAVEHFSYHVGQIAFWVKQLCEEDLGFYRDHNLNQLNK